MNKNVNKLKIFISYSHKNMKYKEKLLTSLEALRQSYNIEPWHDGEIKAGKNIDNSVKQALLKSNVILLLITDNYLASYYCMKVELEEAIKREREGKCIVIPVMFQESVLSETLEFFKHNRVPEDGKPIATSFKNQSQGCARAVNLIKKMIDETFPNCMLKSSNKQIRKTTKTTENNLYMELYKNGKLTQIPITQNIIDSIPKCYKAINKFRTMMDQSLLKAKKQYSREYKNANKNLDLFKQLELLRMYLMEICAYTKMFITENTGIKVHFRASKSDAYLGLIASTDNDDKIDLSCDWTTKMTPIPMYQGLIYHSSRFQSLNLKFNFKGNNDKIWKDYVTFTFPQFHTGQTPLISYGISVHKDYYKVKGDILKILAYLNLGDVIEKYIYDYCEICKHIDKTYELEQIINIL